jgi:hypothetical protein
MRLLAILLRTGRADQLLYLKWTFQQDGNQHEWFIKSSCSGKYLGIEGNPNQGAVAVVVSNPFKWNIIDSDMEHAKGIRFACLSCLVVN